MFALYSARDLMEAELLAHRLAEAGIEYVIRNRYLQGAIGELPASLRPEVCVLRAGDVARAEAIRDEFERNRAAPLTTEELTCPACGETSPANFELCWRCQSPLFGERASP
ncbi:MAG TPA: DUF2007 domain-containing protein [Polyangiaceae bacterium]|nr:DUF2007 domain-containing protein [Polyangiaceae bacterium]